MKTTVLTILFLAAMPLAAWSDPISVTQSLDRTEMAFEDTAHFEIQITWEGPVSAYLFDRPVRLESDKLKVARFSSKVSSSGQGDSEITTKLFRYSLVPTLSGSAYIEPATIDYLKWPDSVSGQLSTDPLTLTIAQPIPAVHKNEGAFSWWMIVLIIGGVIAVAVALLIVVKKKEPKEIVRPPRVTFLEKLKQLDKEAGGDLKQFQTGLYRILVEYLKDAADLHCDNHSLNSVIDGLVQTKLSQTQKDMFQSWLNRAEREKYSPDQKTPGETIRISSEVRQFFESMK